MASIYDLFSPQKKEDGVKFKTFRVNRCPESDYIELRGHTNHHYAIGDSISDVYRGQSGLPEKLSDDIFSVRETSTPRILYYEKEFEQNTRNAISSLGGVEGTYFIGNCGVAHLFGVAVALREQGVDLGFYINIEAFSHRPELGIRSNVDAALYYADTFSALKDGISLTDRSIATLIDYHRVDSIKPDHLNERAFATLDELRSRDIQRIVVLGEDFPTIDGVIRPSESDLIGILNKYVAAGFEVNVIRIDSREPKLNGF